MPMVVFFQQLLEGCLDNYCSPAKYTVKLARANLLAMAAGKLFRKLIYLRMQTKTSAGKRQF